MSFCNLGKAKKKYTEEPMKGNVERLIDFDAYHCLLSGGMGAAVKVQEKLTCVPAAFLDWLKICDGGLLFDTVLLSTKEHDAELDLDFDTYDELNSGKALSEFGLPEGYAIFAMRSYGDPICFNVSARDGKVYLWDVENQEFSDIWDSFEDWLTEEIDDAVSLIAEGVLESLGVKNGGDTDE